MKKTNKTLALIAAASLIMGGLFLSCSNSSDDDDDYTTTEQSGTSSNSETETSTDNKGDSGNQDATDTTSTTTPAATVATDYTLNIVALAAKGNVKESSADFDATGVTKIWAVATSKSIQAFGSSNGSAPFVKMTGGGANITSSAQYGLQVKIDAAATVTITALTKQDKTAGQWILKTLDADGFDVESTGTPAVASAELKDANRTQETTPATLTFANVSAGTYMLGAKSDGGYLFSLNIAY